MKTRFLLSILMLAFSGTSFATTWTITNSGITFSPATITITQGDNVSFSLAISHNAVEVSETTWNANGNTPLSGGFSTPFGGGQVLADKLTAGTHFYVCSPHASMGMKGKIIVQTATAVDENQDKVDISVFPNPSNGQFQVTINDLALLKNADLAIYNVVGEKVYQAVITDSNPTIVLNHPVKGIYLLKIGNGEAILTKKIVVQ
jgi:plastocyanin